MVEYIIIFIILCSAVIGAVVAIPYGVVLLAEAEKDINHTFNIFIEEAGYRGVRVQSAVFVLMPASFMGFPAVPIEYIIPVSLCWAYFLFEHSKLYKGVVIFSNDMILALLVVVTVLFSLGAAVNYGYVGKGLVFMLTFIISMAWGIMVNLKRSRIIRHNKSNQSERF